MKVLGSSYFFIITQLAEKNVPVQKWSKATDHRNGYFYQGWVFKSPTHFIDCASSCSIMRCLKLSRLNESSDGKDRGKKVEFQRKVEWRECRRPDLNLNYNFLTEPLEFSQLGLIISLYHLSFELFKFKFLTLFLIMQTKIKDKIVIANKSDI